MRRHIRIGLDSSRCFIVSNSFIWV